MHESNKQNQAEPLSWGILQDLNKEGLVRVIPKPAKKTIVESNP